MSTRQEALRHTPLPLVHADRRLAVLFSPKAGCTYAVKWFFRHTGLLETATFYDPWVHAFRNRVFYQSKGYRPRAMLEPGFRVAKFVRNPYERAVSSYIHAIRAANLDEPMARFLGRPVTGPRRFSFREMVAWLESEPLTARRRDPHVKTQVHELERTGFAPTRIVRVEEAASVVPRLERDWGLADTSADGLTRSGHHTSRATDEAPCADRDAWPTEGLAESERFPAAGRFYDGSLIARVRQLYAADFAAYGYDPNDFPG